MTFKKGDRVSVVLESGKTVYGVVTRGGRRIIMRADGGKQEVSGVPVLFSLSTEPLPKDEPSVMDNWGVKGYKEISGHGDSPTFHAKITFGGKVVGEAMNDGWGGPNSYHFKTREIDAQFYADINSWVKQFGYPDMFEPSGTWLDWYVMERPYGVTAESSIQDHKKSMEEITAKYGR